MGFADLLRDRDFLFHFGQRLKGQLFLWVRTQTPLRSSQEWLYPDPLNPDPSLEPSYKETKANTTEICFFSLGGGAWHPNPKHAFDLVLFGGRRNHLLVKRHAVTKRFREMSFSPA